MAGPRAEEGWLNAEEGRRILATGGVKRRPAGIEQQ